jgi:hypothetical protein
MLSKEEKQRAMDNLHIPLQESLLFSKPSFDIVANYQYIEMSGKQILLQNMAYCKDTLKLPPFDPDNPYEDYDCKNLYFSAANKLCQSSLWNQGVFPFAEKYYRTMLAVIKKFESDTDYNHNKGMVYANLGIAQAIQLRIDEGFANILKALDEDRGYFQKGKKPDEEFFNSILFQQLENVIVLDPLVKQFDVLRKDEETCPTAKDFLKSLTDPHQRIFFEYTYAKIVENHKVLSEKPNNFSANRLITYLQDMCLFAEDFLKKKNYTGTLSTLLSTAFSPIDLSGCSTSSSQELNDTVENIYRETNKRDRALRILLTLRNFSSHNIAACETGDFIPSNFSEVFNEIVRAVILINNLPQFTQQQP